MTSMLSLTTRIGLARLAVRINSDQPEDDLGALGSEISQARADILLLGRGDTPHASQESLTSLRRQVAGRAICGLEVAGGPEVPAADLIVWGGRGPAPRSSRWSLVGVERQDEDGIAEALTNDEVDFVIVPPAGLQAAIRVAAPQRVDSTPWFVTVNSRTEAIEAVAGGARRLMIGVDDPAAFSESGLRPREVVDAYRQLLIEPWRADMTMVSVSSFKRPLT